MKILCTVAMAGLMLAATGCEKPIDAVAPQSQTGIMRVNMVDSPAGYDAVNIVIDSLQAHIATMDSTSGWVSLNVTPGTYNLLTYVNGNFALVANSSLPAGRYSQIRLFIGSGSNVVVDGETKPLMIPSGVQSGVKLNIDAEIVADAATTITFDFDANLSVVKSGNPLNPTYVLRPVIRTTTTSSTGFIAGAILPTSARPTIWATSETQDTLTTTTDATGGFRFLYVSPGSYSLMIVSKDTLYLDKTMVGVNVSAYATANLGVITLDRKY